MLDLALVVGLSTSMRFAALVEKPDYWTAPVIHLDNITVATMRMLVSSAKVVITYRVIVNPEAREPNDVP